jgi:iron-sulfur cluster repair protein YtfE (RIC family)
MQYFDRSVRLRTDYSIDYCCGHKLLENNNTATKINGCNIFDRFKNIKHSTVRPKAFTDKGLYMLATILKSPKSTQTTIAIIETYSKLVQFSKAIQSISENKNEKTNKELIEKGRTILSEILVGDTQFDETETSIQLNFALLKLKHIVKRKK